MNTGTGTMENFIPNCPYTFKASLTHDSDTPNMGEAMKGPYRKDFLEDMGKYIYELESHDTWNVIDRTSLPEEVNILPLTWAFNIKRYPDDRLRKFKARFCAIGEKQFEGIDYVEKYDPVFSWSTVRMMMRVALNQNWKTRQVDSTNDFIQAKIKEYVYITLPHGFVIVLTLKIKI